MPSEYLIAIVLALLPVVYAIVQAVLSAQEGGSGNGGTDTGIRVVCSGCAADLTAAKGRGIEAAMQRLAELLGDGGLPINAAILPLSFHLDGDSYCGPYQSGMTGNFSLDSTGKGHVCLFDLEKENRMLPFTVENAEKIQDQLLPVHEAMHGWFLGRQGNYLIQEPFCKLISFIITEMAGGPEYCDWFASTPDGHPDALMKYLCPLGMTSARGVEILKRVAGSAAAKGSALTEAEFAAICTAVLGQDAVPAFRSAGILP